jgi:hypothetical protein
MNLQHLVVLARVEERLADASRRRLAAGTEPPAPLKQPERQPRPTEVPRVAPLPNRLGSQ